MFQPIDDRIESSAGPQHADRHQHPYEVRDDADRRVEPALWPLDKGVKNIDSSGTALLPRSQKDKKDEPAAKRAGKRLHAVRVQGPEIKDQRGDQQGQAPDPGQDDRLETG
jgi:hypothetical protein